MLRQIFLLCSCLIATAANAQNNDIPYLRSAPVILKLAPLWLLDADPAVAGGLEIRTGKRTSVQGEFGYGWPGWRDPDRTDQHAGTWRMKAEMRFYQNRYRTNRRANINVSTTYPLGNYWALEAYTKILNIHHNWAYYDPATNPYPYTLPGESRQSLIRRNSLTITAKIGRQFGWDDNAHQGKARVLWDIYAGLGIRLTNQTNDGQAGVPGYFDTYRYRSIFSRFDTNGFHVSPTLTAGIKLGFAL